MSRSHLLRRFGAFSAAALCAMLAACDSAPTAPAAVITPAAESPTIDEATLVLLNPAGIDIQDVHVVPCGRAQISDDGPSVRIDDASSREWTLHLDTGCYDVTVLDGERVVWRARAVDVEAGRVTYVLLGAPGIPTPPFIDDLLRRAR